MPKPLKAQRHAADACSIALTLLWQLGQPTSPPLHHHSMTEAGAPARPWGVSGALPAAMRAPGAKRGGRTSTLKPSGSSAAPRAALAATEAISIATASSIAAATDGVSAPPVQADPSPT